MSASDTSYPFTNNFKALLYGEDVNNIDNYDDLNSYLNFIKESGSSQSAMRYKSLIQRINNKNKRKFLDKYGTETSNNFQLLHWAKQLKNKNFHVLMRDEIKEMTDDNFKKPLNIITNNNTSDENGSHWSAFHKKDENVFDSVPQKFCFDSYGSPVLEEIVQTFKSPILGNTSKFQEFKTSCCGQLSLYFLHKTNYGKSMEEICIELF